MERIARSHFNLMTNEEQSPNLCCENSPLVLPKPSKGIFPPGGQGAFSSGPLGVLEQQTGNNSSPVLHSGWRGIWKATVPFVFQLYPGCVQAPSRLVGLRDLQTGSNVEKGSRNIHFLVPACPRSVRYEEENQGTLSKGKEEGSFFSALPQAWLIIKPFRNAPAEQVRGWDETAT